MKNIVRMKTSLVEEVEQILNEQVKMEANSSSKYLAMASWCQQRGFSNAGDFLMIQAGEERNHMLKIFNHILDRGGVAFSPEVSHITHEFANLREVFEIALEQEIAVTHAIHRILDVARKAKDYTTEYFMQWFINEQIEEEAVARRIVELFDVIGEEGQGLYLIDKEIATVRAAFAAANAGGAEAGA
ncbi:MAG: ferritin [Cytophagales bacterium]|nr:MAG: ferritin [Cytophagales bacterium]